MLSGRRFYLKERLFEFFFKTRKCETKNCIYINEDQKIKEIPVHYYHFILDRKTIDALLKWGARGHNGSLSRIIRDIVSGFFSRVKRFHVLGLFRKREYELIHSDPEVPRQDVWFSMEEEVYEYFCQVRCELKVFSLAQLIRKVIGEFLEGRGEGAGPERPHSARFFFSQDQFLQHMLKESWAFPWKLKEFLII